MPGTEERGAAARLSPVPRACPELRVLPVAEHAAEAVAGEGVLDGTERARLHAFLQRADRDRFRVAHVALRRELGRRLGIPPEEVVLVREDCPLCGGPHGRPAVAGGRPHFSLSHSGDLVVLALADAPVGVDTEVLPTPRVAGELAAALHPTERAELAALAPAELPAAFARCWTRKEAYLKGLGTGLGQGPEVTYVGTGLVPASVPGWLLRDLPVPGPHAAAWALRTG